MSGDVQPRKRKDKRRKKEGGSLGSIHDPVTSHKFKRADSDDRKIFEVPDKGETIHVQNEHGIGGNICVKIIFFCLFALLIGAVGLIYLQSQGSTDVDLPTIEESRFAEYFTGWLDDSTDDHEHDAHESIDNDHDEHEEGEGDEEHEEHEHDDDHDEHEEEDQSPEQDIFQRLFGLQTEEPEEPEEKDVEESYDRSNKAEESEEAEDKPDVDEDEDENNEEDEDDEDNNEEDDDDDNNNEEDSKEDDDKEVDEEEESKENEDSGVDLDENEEDDDEKSKDKDDEDEDEYDASQMDEDEEEEEKPIKKITKVEEEEEEDDDEDDEDIEKSKEDDDEEEEEDEKVDPEDSEEDEKDNKKPDEDDLGYDEIDMSEEEEDEKEQIEVSEEEIKPTKVTLEEEEEEKKEEEEEEGEGEGGGVAVKLGVGIALIIVAHLVLVQKWKSQGNAPPDETAAGGVEEPIEKSEIENVNSEVEPIIFRRQTLVPEDVYLNDECEEDEELLDEEEEEEEEEENAEEDEEVYSEEDEEEVIEKKTDTWQTFEKPKWEIEKEVEEEEEDVEDEEYVEEEAEGEEEEEEEEEEDDYEEEEMEDDKFYKKEPKIEELPVREEAPVPPPRSSRAGRGAQDSEEDFSQSFQDFDQVTERIHEIPKVEEEKRLEKSEDENPNDRKTGFEDEWGFKQELEFAQEHFENNPKAAIKAYDNILSKKSTMISALMGRARALDHLAEKERSNVYLKQAINAYKSLLLDHGHRLKDDLYLNLAERCIERMRFAGALNSAIDLHKAMIIKFPDTPKYRNALAETYLMLNKNNLAKRLLNETLSIWPNNGFALVHYGFILKVNENNMEEGAKMLMAGIKTGEKGATDGMFLYHLGDALTRLGRDKEAKEFYDLGVKEGVFLSRYQRSLYNVNRLKGQPWWTKEETTYQDFFKKLEENWREIRREGLELYNSRGVNLFKQESENLKHTGDWRQLDLYFRGRKQGNCDKAPITCSLVSSFKPASSCTRGQIKFSVMLPETHAWPHCGPTNCRLRSHLGLLVPKKTYIRVAEEIRSWEEGKFLIFDDSFEHEVWHNGTGPRLVLIVDVWHPELTNHERRTLSPI